MKILMNSVLLLCLLPAIAVAQQPPNVGLPAKIELLAEQLEATNEQVLRLREELAQTQSELAALQQNTVLQLDDIVAFRYDADGLPTVVVSGVNLQVVNGSHMTGAVNGVGNVILGYNERGSTAASHDGSHNLVLGDEQAYPATGQLVTDSMAGEDLTIQANERVILRSGQALQVMEKDGSISLSGKDVLITGSGEIEIKASGDLVLKGATIQQN